MLLPLTQLIMAAMAAVMVAVVSSSVSSTLSAQEIAPQCEQSTTQVRVPELAEGSGVAASRKTPGAFWSHNDSGKPMLLSLDEEGRVTGHLTLSGATVVDWEAVAVGPCPAGSCIYVADIGDNEAERKDITVYRVAEADAAESAQKADVFHASYPDRAQNAETLLVTPAGRLYVVTKGDTGPVTVYRFPEQLSDGGTMRLEKVGAPRDSRASNVDDRITDGAVSPDGQWIVLRTTQSLRFYRASELLEGAWREAHRVSLTPLAEPQGEGVTFGPDNAIYLIGEGARKKRPGTFARLNCTLAR